MSNLLNNSNSSFNSQLSSKSTSQLSSNSKFLDSKHFKLVQNSSIKNLLNLFSKKANKSNDVNQTAEEYFPMGWSVKTENLSEKLCRMTIKKPDGTEIVSTFERNN